MVEEKKVAFHPRVRGRTGEITGVVAGAGDGLIGKWVSEIIVTDEAENPPVTIVHHHFGPYDTEAEALADNNKRCQQLIDVLKRVTGEMGHPWMAVNLKTDVVH